MRIFAKLGTSEKILVPFINQTPSQIIQILNKNFGEEWIFVEQLKQNEILKFSDNQIYEGYDCRNTRFCEGIERVEPIESLPDSKEYFYEVLKKRMPTKLPVRAFAKLLETPTSYEPGGYIPPQNPNNLSFGEEIITESDKKRNIAIVGFQETNSHKAIIENILVNNKVQLFAPENATLVIEKLPPLKPKIELTSISTEFNQPKNRRTRREQERKLKKQFKNKY